MPLYSAAARHGGVRYWRRELGFAEPGAGGLRAAA
jgi:hypothetical protein